VAIICDGTMRGWEAGMLLIEENAVDRPYCRFSVA